MSGSTKEAFRRLALGDEAGLANLLAEPPVVQEAPTLVPRLRAMVRIGALIALDAPSPLYRAEVGAAMAEGLDLDDLLGLLMAVADQVGWPRIVAAAPRIAIAAGYDIDVDFDRPPVPGAGA